MFGSVEKQVSWLPFQYKQCTKEKKESINEMLLMETRCIIPMGLDRIACCTEWCMQQGIIPIIIIIYPGVFSCVGEGRRKSTVKSNVLKCPSVLWLNNAAIKRETPSIWRCVLPPCSNGTLFLLTILAFSCKLPEVQYSIANGCYSRCMDKLFLCCKDRYIFHSSYCIGYQLQLERVLAGQDELEAAARNSLWSKAPCWSL